MDGPDGLAERSRRRAARPRRRCRSTLVGLAAAIAAVTLAGCSNTPQAVIHVPGNYVADLWENMKLLPGGATGAAVVCLDTPSALFFETGEGSEGGVGRITLDWNGTQYQTENVPITVTLTTPVLDPGCGVVTFSPDCCHVDHYLAIKVTKV